MKLKTVAMTGVMSLAGLGLIGVGAHAAVHHYHNEQPDDQCGRPRRGAVRRLRSEPCDQPSRGLTLTRWTCNSITLPAPDSRVNVRHGQRSRCPYNVGNVPVTVISFT